ncbi:MAG: carbohydrate ABC transporter permease [Spirochaetia bacterium]
MKQFKIDAHSIMKNKIVSLAGQIAVYTSLIFATLIILLPLLIILSSAFKPESEIFEYPMKWIPRNITFNNFAKLRQGNTDFLLYIFNSLKVTITIVAVQLLTATTGAYAFAKMKWKAREFVFLLYIGTMMIPGQVFVIPQFIIVKNLGLYNSHAALVFVGAFTAFGTFLVKQFFMTIPDSLIEAARIDGASEYRTFTTLILPLSKPVLATLIIFSFRYFWNDFFAPLIYLTSPELKTLALGMSDFASEYFTYYGPQMAASLIAIVPVMVMFLFLQRFIMRGVVTTGIKG